MPTYLHPEAANALRLAGPDPKPWIPVKEGVDHDVVIIGAGQTGTAIAYGLRRKGLDRVLVLDQAPEGSSTWNTYARMNTLRTPKNLPGPDQLQAALWFQAWYEGRRGVAAYEELTRIPRLEWDAYLHWLRRTLGIRVRHETSVLDVAPAEAGLRVELEQNGERTSVTARKVVLATGFAGGGGAYVPAHIQRLPRASWVHTCEDLGTLDGRTVGVLGAGASAFDAAATALEGGAKEVHLFSRRPRLNYSDPSQGPSPTAHKSYPGAREYFHLLPDPVRWTHQLLQEDFGASVPVDSIHRATGFENFHLHLATGDLAFTPDPKDESRLAVTVAGESLELDRLIVGTGFEINLARRPELTSAAAEIATWGDRYQPGWGEFHQRVAGYPYLGDSFEFVERVPGRAPWLRDLHCYNVAASVSSGKFLSDIPSMVELPRLLNGIVRDLFLADLDEHIERINTPLPAVLPDAPYAAAVRSA